MFLLQKIRSSMQDDPLLQRVVRNSGYLFSSSTVSAALNVVQGIFIIRLLGGSGFGLLTIVMDFASNVNRLLSFRMSEVVVRYVGGAMAKENNERAAALVKGIGLTEIGASVLAYLALLALSSWGAKIFANNLSVVYLFRFYG